MAGEIATAYIALVPSLHGFGTAAARQIGPQAKAVGTRAGQQAGQAFTTAASKESAGWFAQTAQGALKNVALYGSMYAVITSVSRGISASLEAMVGFNAEIEQATIGFETLLGSASAAQAEMQWIKDFAKETPFNYKDLVGYSQQLLALGFNAEESKAVLQATGDAAAALGRGTDSIARINLALGQMWTKGKVQSQEMLQLTEAGIGAWQILADAYGTSVEQVQDRVTRGLIKATDAVPALIAGMNAKFGGLMEKQSQTFTGIVSNIQDTLQQELAGAGEPLFAALKEQAQSFLEALDDPQVLQTMHDLGNLLADGVTILSQAAKVAWQFRDAIIAVGIAYAASKLLMRASNGSILSPATWTAALGPMKAYRAGVETLGGAIGETLKPLRGGVQIAGLAGVADGYRRVSEAASEGQVSATGFAESIAGGTIAGAAFGSVIPGVGTAVGAVSGAVIGLATSVWSYQAAAKAANADTSTFQTALQNLGVDANLASLALNGVTNTQLEAAGGFGKMLDALKSGTYDEYLAKLQSQSDAMHKQLEDQAAALAEYKATAYATNDTNALLTDDFINQQGAVESLTKRTSELDAAIASLNGNSGATADAQEAITASAYQSAYAMDLQTGSLGTMTEAAWAAVQAQGGLSNEALYAAARMEGLGGSAGYASQMIAGIPVNTPIHFTTNASEILQKIIALQSAATAGFGSTSAPYEAVKARIAELQKQYQDALKGTDVKLDLPKVPKAPKRGGAGTRAVDTARKAADDAARKLASDREAQRRFGEAFSSLMESALEGDWDQYREKLADQIKSLTEDGYKKAAKQLKALSRTLTTAARDYAVLTGKLEAATDAYDDLTGAMQDQYNTSRDLILGLGKITDAQSFDQLAYLLGETTSRASEYQTVLKQLKSQGLSEDLWNQLAQAGPESMALAQSILSQGQAGIDQLNSLSTGLVGAAESMGSLVSDSMYGQGVDAMNAYIEGLKSQSTALENQLEIIANNVLTKTAGAITPGNAGYSKIDTAPQQVVNQYNVTLDMSKINSVADIEKFIVDLNQAPTTQLVNAAGTVTS